MAEGNILVKFISGFFGVLFKDLRRTILTIGVLLIFITGLSLSLEQRSFQPFVDQVGNVILKADHTLYNEAKSIELNQGLFSTYDSLWKKITTYTRILAPIYFMLLILFFVNMLMTKSAGISGMWSFLWSFIIVALIIFSTESFTSARDAGESAIPFKGIFSIIKVSPFIIDPIVSNPSIQNNLPGNQINYINQSTNISECLYDVCY